MPCDMTLVGKTGMILSLILVKIHSLLLIYFYGKTFLTKYIKVYRQCITRIAARTDIELDLLITLILMTIVHTYN